MRIALIGNYGASNIGDEAILQSILKNHPAHSFSVFSADPQGTTRRHGVLSVPLFPCGLRSFFRNGFKTSIAALQKVDAVVFGGGGLMQDDKLYACFIWAWQIFWVKRLKKPLFVYATGVGPLRTKLGRGLTKYIYDYAKAVTVRDEASGILLKDLGISPDKITVTADPAFLVDAPRLKSRTQNLFIINLRPWKNSNKSTLDIMTKFLVLLKEKSHARYRFVVMQKGAEEDATVLQQLANRFNEQIFYPKDFVELMDCMAETEAAIGMRYHFSIAALMTGTPLLGISYSPKVSSLFQRLPGQSLDVKDLSSEEFEVRWQSIMEEQHNISQIENAEVNLNRIGAQKNAEKLEVFLKTFDPSKAFC